MRLMSYFNVRSRTSFPKTLPFADTFGSQMASSPAMTLRESYPLECHYNGRMSLEGRKKGLSPIQHVEGVRGHSPGGPYLP